MSFIVTKFAFYCNVPLCDRAVSVVKHKIPLLNFCKIRQMIDGRGYYRQQYSCRHFLGPVTLYSVLYNLPKFFELQTGMATRYPNQTLEGEEGWSPSANMSGEQGEDIEYIYRIDPTEMRINEYYIKVRTESSPSYHVGMGLLEWAKVEI